MVTVNILGTNKQDKIPVTKEMRVVLRRSCAMTLYEEGYSGEFEVSVTFVDDDEMQYLNKKYRDIDSPTDVLSFPANDNSEEFMINPETGCAVLGDIVISLETAVEQAHDVAHNLNCELAILTVHSMLHLLGYDHVTNEEDEKRMFGKQGVILEAIGVHEI